MQTEKNGQNIKMPYTAALATLRGLMLIGLLPMAGSMGLRALGHDGSAYLPFLIIGTILCAILGFCWGIIWVRSRVLAGRMREFLNSDRPLMRWTYTAGEWQRLRETAWQSEKDVWQFQMGCLSVLFALTGLLTGVMVGADEGWAEAVVGAASGLGIGLLVGGGIGGIVAGLNHGVARRAYHDEVPAQVALGWQEILFDNEYFRGNGMTRFIRSAELGEGYPPSALVFEIYWPQFRRGTEQEWVISVPPRVLRTLEETLPAVIGSPPDAP
ncbi:hypothetical protein DENIS_3504 [Desulfonema ishimotonii]|uniref:Uncharacterized protein n=1 Tax=Desulfonema ishimotonii TaxID=45657 RepID=A0A401FZX0_9BACT|nr:hypothetical protein [Desulfonema ishimotonii]GBC62532.1 hypothetical protein DENIS_3504 [Desulfonema ishimotonii]